MQIFYLASPKPIHQRFTGEIYRKLKNYIEEKEGNCEVLIAPMGVYLNCDDRTRVEPEQRNVTVCWFEDETHNCQYSFDEEIGFHLFPDLKLVMGEMVRSPLPPTSS